MAEKQKADEKRKVGASYIFSFYNEIQILTHNYAQYDNFIIEIRNKYGGKDDLADENEKKQIIDAIQSVRYSVNKCFIMYKSIMPSLKIPEDSQIEEGHKEINENFIPKLELIENYVILLNKVLVNDVVKNLLESNQDIIQDIYSDGNP